MKGLKIGLAVLAGIVVVGGSYAVAAGYVSFNLPFSFASGPTLVISTNVNSPASLVLPGRSQTLGVFDVKSANLTNILSINTIPFKVSIANAGNLNIGNFFLDYQYCLSKGSINQYGYKYGYSGTYCKDIYVTPASVTRTNDGYTVLFSNNLPVYTDAVSARLSFGALPSYKTNPLKQPAAKIKVAVGGDILVGYTSQCRVIHYGLNNMYGYTKCVPTKVNINVKKANTPWLVVSRAYGYGYSFPAPIASTGKCGLTVLTPAPFAAVSFPLTIGGVIDNSNSAKLGCSWGMFEGIGGVTQLSYKDNSGWHALNAIGTIQVANWTATSTSFTSTLNLATGDVRPATGTTMKITFLEDSPSGVAPVDTFDFPVVMK